MSDVATQIPPADEFHTVREQRKVLEKREAELRQLLLSDPSARTGNAYVIELRNVTRPQTDTKALKEIYPEAYEATTFPQTVTHLIPMRITEDGEIVSLRRKQP